MRLLLSAPSAPPRFEGQQLLRAARGLGFEAELFDHPASRDPTLDLPDLVSRMRPDIVLLVAPEREDPWTLDLLRRNEARVALWYPPAPERAPSWLASRRTWLSRAADLVAVTDSGFTETLRDRSGNAAFHLPRGFDGHCLGIAENPAAPDKVIDWVAVRGADDPLRVARSGPDRIVGYGPPEAFGRVANCRPLDRGVEFAAAVRGRRYLSGGRLLAGPPSVFDDVAAALAAGASAIEVPYMGRLSDGSALATEPTACSFAERLRTLMSRIEEIDGF